MPDRLPHEEIVRRCLRRVQVRRSIPGQDEWEQDWLDFVSAFTDCIMRREEIEHALKWVAEKGVRVDPVQGDIVEG